MYTVVSCSRAPLRLCQLVGNEQSAAGEAARRRQGGGSPESACQAREGNTTQSFNSDHEKQPRGPVKWRFGCASRQFASFYRSVIWKGRPRGNLKCWKLNWYCCGAAQSHLHLTPFCWYNHIPAGVCLRLGSSFKMQKEKAGERVIIAHKISPVFKLTCASSHNYEKWFIRRPGSISEIHIFFVIQLRDSKREVVFILSLECCSSL